MGRFSRHWIPTHTADSPHKLSHYTSMNAIIKRKQSTVVRSVHDQTLYWGSECRRKSECRRRSEFVRIFHVDA